jgi:hypothetical protein
VTKRCSVAKERAGWNAGLSAAGDASVMPIDAAISPIARASPERSPGTPKGRTSSDAAIASSGQKGRDSSSDVSCVFVFGKCHASDCISVAQRKKALEDPGAQADEFRVQEE